MIIDIAGDWDETRKTNKIPVTNKAGFSLASSLSLS